jgi:hypothetical protein
MLTGSTTPKYFRMQQFETAVFVTETAACDTQTAEFVTQTAEFVTETAVFVTETAEVVISDPNRRQRDFKECEVLPAWAGNDGVQGARSSIRCMARSCTQERRPRSARPSLFLRVG